MLQRVLGHIPLGFMSIHTNILKQTGLELIEHIEQVFYQPMASVGCQERNPPTNPPPKCG